MSKFKKHIFDKFPKQESQNNLKYASILKISKKNRVSYENLRLCNPKKAKIEGKGLKEGIAELESMFIINMQDCGTGGSWNISCDGPGFIGNGKHTEPQFFFKRQYVLAIIH